MAYSPANNGTPNTYRNVIRIKEAWLSRESGFHCTITQCAPTIKDPAGEDYCISVVNGDLEHVLYVSDTENMDWILKLIKEINWGVRVASKLDFNKPDPDMVEYILKIREEERALSKG